MSTAARIVQSSKNPSPKNNSKRWGNYRKHESRKHPTPRVQLLHKCNHYAIFNKPAGVLSQPDAQHLYGETPKFELMQCLEKQYKSLWYIKRRKIQQLHPPKMVHRLDFQVSGAIVLGRSVLGTEMISRNLKKGGLSGWPMVKKYAAILDGKVDNSIPRNGPITIPVNGKPALTYYQLFDKKPNQTFVMFQLMTGRKHQLREHAEKVLGKSILQINDNQIALHSCQLTVLAGNFTHTANAKITSGLKVWKPYLDEENYVFSEFTSVDFEKEKNSGPSSSDSDTYSDVGFQDLGKSNS